MEPNLGERPHQTDGGESGYTVQQTSRLLDRSESSVRSSFKDDMIRREGAPSLCPEGKVNALRVELLKRIGAVEPTSGVDIDVELRVRTLEAKLRLLLSARSSAREADRHNHAQEAALHDAILMDLGMPANWSASSSSP